MEKNKEEKQVFKLKEIAEELGLSVTTVSRAMRNKGRISEGTRKRVMDAIEQYNYIPNDLARALRLKDTRSIGIIISDVTNSFFAGVVKGAQSIVHDKEYSLLIGNSDENIKLEEEALDLMRCKQINGLIIATVGADISKINIFGKLGIPVVFIDNLPLTSEKYNSVSIGNLSAAVTLTNEVIKRGYRKIGMVTGALDQSTGRYRLEGFKKALAEAEIPYNEKWIFEGDFKQESGRKSMEKMLSLGDRPEAIIFSNNYMTYGGVKFLKKIGMKIPKDIAVAAFDLIDDTGLMSPQISSINQDPVEIGIQAVRLLIDKIENRNSLGYKNIILTPTIYNGRSW